MSQDASSPNEAAIAARRVGKLMAEYNLEMSDLIREELNDDDNLVEVSFDRVHRTRFELWLQSLAIEIARALDCQVTFEFDEKGKKLVFQGFEPDVMVANWLLGYCYDAIQRLARESYRLHGKQRTYLSAFKKGAALEVQRNIRKVYGDSGAEAIDDHNRQSLVAIKQQRIAAHFGEASYGKSRQRCRDAEAYQQGQAAGKSIAIQKVMGKDVAIARLMHADEA